MISRPKLNAEQTPNLRHYEKKRNVGFLEYLSRQMTMFFSIFLFEQISTKVFDNGWGGGRNRNLDLDFM